MTSVMITSEKLDAFGQAVTKALPDAVTSFTVTPFAHGEPELTVHVKPETIIAVLTHLRDDPGCQFYAFIDITAVDWPQREKRFDVVYHLLSPTQNARIRIKIEVGEDETVASATGVFLGANWFEREVYDLYGIVFTGHPDMRRILTDYGFDGHPLRKDFPLSGFVEVRWDDEQKRVVYSPVQLAQEFRNFDFLSPWEGTHYVLPGDEKAGKS
jgi:NADH-quinone oxidoreductase subunit C